MEPDSKSALDEAGYVDVSYYITWAYWPSTA